MSRSDEWKFRVCVGRSGHTGCSETTHFYQPIISLTDKLKQFNCFSNDYSILLETTHFYPIISLRDILKQL